MLSREELSNEADRWTPWHQTVADMEHGDMHRRLLRTLHAARTMAKKTIHIPITWIVLADLVPVTPIKKLSGLMSR